MALTEQLGEEAAQPWETQVHDHPKFIVNVLLRTGLCVLLGGNLLADAPILPQNAGQYVGHRGTHRSALDSDSGLQYLQ